MLAAGSDIGAALARVQLARGAEVLGTYRTRTAEVEGLETAGARMVQVDVSEPSDVARLAEEAVHAAFDWDAWISAPGLLSPIGPFFSVPFDAWENSVRINSTAQLRALHALYPRRRQGATARVVFFAGGGTNGPFDNYSAYCIGKLSLIKMTELLDSECPDLKVSIVGTGWVDTKIHRQTLAAGGAAGSNLDRTRRFLDRSAEGGVEMDRVVECIDWVLGAPRAAVGGRNFSLVHDAWPDPAFVDRLAAEPGTYKLRRAS